MNTTIKLSLLTTLLLNANLFAEEQLEDITVTTATKTTQNINDVTSNINVITAQEIEERHYTTIAQALNSLPGVSYTSNGGLGKSTSIRIRGFDSKRVLVLIDGIRQNDVTGISGAPFSDLLISDIEQIELIKGAQSGIWGADATAGVINIITKKAKEGTHIYASEEFGQFNSSKTSLGASYKNHLFYLKADMTKVDTSGFTAKAPKNKDIDAFEDDGYENQTINLKAGLQLNESNKITLTHTLLKSTNEYDTNVYDGYTLNPEKSANSYIYSTTNNTYSSAEFNHIDSFNELTLYAKRSIFNRDYPLSSSKFYDGETKEYGINSKIPYLLDSFILIGGDYKKFSHQNDLNREYTNKAGFITNHNQFQNSIGSTIISQSLRYDDYSSFKSKTTGKVGLKQTFSSFDDLALTANYGTAYNIPTLYQLFEPGNTYFGTYYPIGNENLIPETTRSMDISLAFQGFMATYFSNKIDNLIDYTNGYNNLEGTSRIKGYELSYNTILADEIALNLSYTRTKAKDADGFTLPGRVGKSVKFGIDYYGVEDLHLGLNGEYVGDRIEYSYGTHDVDAQTGNYTIANFVANYNWDKYLSFYGKVDNITDKYYQTVDGYATSPRAFYGGMKLTY